MSSHQVPSDLERWIVSRLAEVLRLDPRAIDRRERFNRYGLDSVKATAFTGELAAHLGRSLPPTLMWDRPSIEKLVGFLTAPDAAASRAAQPAVAVRAAAPAASPKEPIAIVGLACRFPQAPDPAAYWRLLATGADAITEVPRDRWNLDSVFDLDLAVPGKMNTRWGGFLDQVDRFDAQAFAISPREAAQMDPQQRLILELCSEALDDAGVQAERLRGTATGVFIGAMWSDYARLLAGDASGITSHTATGQDTSVIAGRVSYVYGIQGPSLTVNTACSSSLVAIHLACQSLRAGESTLALVGGVSLVLSPESTVAMSKFGAMAPDGRSKAFDARANGYVRGEGGGVVVLKPLSRALADGDTVYCVILGSATNNDGFSNGLTAPNPQAQENVLRAACTNAGVATDQVQYVEAHGTGTLLGDPIEAGALGAVLGAGRERDRPLQIGSVKTNIGHLEAAAGMAGLIKVALSIRHRLLPPSLHFQSPNPHIRFDDLRLRVQTALGPWPAEGELPTAGVSSFGFGGTNCHVVLQGVDEGRPELLTFADRTDADQRVRARTLADRVGALGAGDDVRDAFEASSQQDENATRAAVVFTSRHDLVRKLTSLADGVPLEGVTAGPANARRGGIVFVCSGHGSQWVGMARTLLQEPVFRAALEECAAAIEAVAGWNAIDELVAAPAVSRVEQFDITQPLLFAISVSLAALWRSWGVEPGAVVGHSMGEVAAACISGALTVEHAAQVICHRSRLLARMVGQGSIAILGLSRAEVERRLVPFSDRVWIAACNGPETTAVSGDPALLEQIVSALQAEKLFARLANAGVPAHSPKVDPLRAELFESVRAIAPRPNPVRMYSTVTAAAIAGVQLGPSYWVRNLREPVLFAQAVEAALADGYDTFVELSPHPVLSTGIEQSLLKAGRAGLVVPSGRRSEDERRVMLESAGRLFVSGRDLGVKSDGSAEGGVSVPIVLSAFTPGGLRAQARAIEQFVRERDVSLRDLAHTTARHRTHLEHRLAVVAASRDELAERLAAWTREQPHALTASGRAGDATPRIGFVFCGQGPQWWGMGRELMRREPVFNEVIVACDRLVRRHADWSLIEELGRPEATSRVDRLDIVQPAIFSIQVALVALWKSWGIEPAAVVGHSMGEVAAAHAAGVLTLEDAVQVVVERGRAVHRTAGQGRTAALELGVAEARTLIAKHGGRVGIAAVNGPRSTTISGEPSAIAAALADLAAQGGLGRELRMDFASHSAQMDPLLNDLSAALGGVVPQSASVPIYSTVTGRRAEGWEFDGAYWGSNLREPVAFQAAFGEMLADVDIALEIGPHPVLGAAMADCAANGGASCATLASLRRGQGERLTMLAAAGNLHVAGVALRWDRVLPPGQLISLPPYRWQRERHWLATVNRTPAVAEPAPGAPGDFGWYDVAWQPMAKRTAAARAARWVIVSDSGGVGEAFAASRRAQGESVVMVARPSSSRGTFDAELAGALKSGDAPTHVVYFAGRDTRDESTSARELHASAVAGCDDVRRIVRQLLDVSAPRVAARLSIVTCGAQGLDASERPVVTQAPLWGVARVLALEHPAIWGGVFDLPRDPADTDAGMLADIILGAGDEDQIAVRNGAAHVARLASSQLARAEGGFTVRGDATYLITGGFGRLGLKVARWLVDRGARHLVLAGRRARNEEALRALERAGADVMLAQGDISDPEWTPALITRLAAGAHPLRGIVHAAGVSTLSPLAALDRRAFENDFAAKVQGTWLLHQASAGVPLDFFVMFSTAAAIWGANDMASYAGANHFLDALAHFRRGAGLPALAVSWGPWDEVGVMPEEIQHQWDRIGIPAMSEREALDTLETLIQGGAITKTVARVEWNRFAAVRQTRSHQPFLEQLGGREGAAVEPAAQSSVNWTSGLDGLTPEERVVKVMAFVQREVCDILGLASGATLDPTRGFAQMGLDSLMAIDLRGRLEKGMGRPLPSPVVFNYPSVRAMASYLAGDDGSSGLIEQPAAGAERSLAVEEIAALSDDEAEALLATRLASLAEGSG